MKPAQAPYVDPVFHDRDFKLVSAGGAATIWVAPASETAGAAIRIRGAGSQRTVKVRLFNPPGLAARRPQTFVESAGVVAMQAENYTRRTDRGGAGWHKLPIWAMDPGIVLDKIVVDLGGLQASYPGPPETRPLGWSPPVGR
jgi:hypothetical protein